MNTQYWITRFQASTCLNHEMVFPTITCELSEEVRKPLAASLATFQLGESGGGTRLRRYARSIAPLESFRGYQRAVDMFVAEEQSHAALLARLVERLDGTLLTRQWTNSVFRWMRDLVNLEFNVQVLLTAELVAEAYFGILAVRATDPAVRAVSRKLLRDEMGHLAFQRDFLFERLRTFTPATQRLWRWQFRAIHQVTAAVVAWDHRQCLRAMGVAPADFRARATRCWRSFQARLERQLKEAAAEGQAPVMVTTLG